MLPSQLTALKVAHANITPHLDIHALERKPIGKGVSAQTDTTPTLRHRNDLIRLNRRQGLRLPGLLLCHQPASAAIRSNSTRAGSSDASCGTSFPRTEAAAPARADASYHRGHPPVSKAAMRSQGAGGSGITRHQVMHRCREGPGGLGGRGGLRGRRTGPSARPPSPRCGVVRRGGVNRVMIRCSSSSWSR